MTLPPLHGTKTHPLTASTRADLERLNHEGPLPVQVFNPGAVNRLLRGGLVRTVMLPSPYKTHKGRNLAHLTITGEGISELGDGGADGCKRRAALVTARRFPVNLKGALASSIRTRGRKART